VRCSPRTRSWTLASLAVLAGSTWLVVAAAAPASAQFEQIMSYHVTIAVQHDGTLAIDERIRYDFGSATDHHGIFRNIPVVYRFDSTRNRIYRLSVEHVTATGGASAKYDVSRSGAHDVIKIGDKNATVSGIHTYDIAYRVEGALNAFSDHDELYWNAIGEEWSVPITDATVDVSIPGTITQVTCFQGPDRSSLPCDDQTFDESGSARFSSAALDPSSGLTVVVGFAKGAVSPAPAPILVDRWSVARAFTLNGVTVGIAAALLLAFAFLFGRLAWKVGRDRRYVGSAVDVAFGPGETAPAPDQEQAVPLFEKNDFPIEFEPPAKIRPGEVGTLLDEVAGTLDVSASIVDLAVRGYLTIEEIPKHGWFGKPDWRLTSAKEADGALKPYETKLLTSLFDSATSTHDGAREVLMSGLKTKFSKKLLEVESALYDGTVAQGWFTARPDKVRGRWEGYGWLVLIVGGVLEFLAIKYTKFALIPVVVVIAGLVMIYAGKRMPARTAKGTAMLRRTLAFRDFVANGTEAAKAKFAEKENLFSEYLPYAIVFGVTERWAKVFASLSDTPPDTSWYRSPNAFSYAYFASSMDHFTTTASGTISSTPAGSGSSGFGGGGFSGGGGGGGGGGSW
jgi:Predicted membrane protein (DUF2207)